MSASTASPTPSCGATPTPTTPTDSPPPTKTSLVSNGRERVAGGVSEFCLRWNNYQSNLMMVFDQLLHKECFVDVTLTTEGKSLKCHKVVLSACSPYFQDLLASNPSQHPIVIMRDISWTDLKYIVEYMYKGEISVKQEDFTSVLKAAEALKVRGLVEFSLREDAESPNNNSTMSRYPYEEDELEIIEKVVDDDNIADDEEDEAPKASKRKRRMSADQSHANDDQGAQQKQQGQQDQRQQQSESVSMSNHVSRGGLVPRPQSALLERPVSPPRSASHLALAPPPPPLPPPPPPPAHHPHPTLPSIPATSHPTAGSFGGGGLTKSVGGRNVLDDFADVKPGIMELIQEEQRAKLLEASQITHNWMQQQHHPGPSGSSASASTRGSPVPGSSNCYQYQLQSMWQKCWNQNAAMLQGMRYRERGPMKSWRPETMAEAIWSVLQEGLSLSQAARKHDIPYPTFVLYANRVHNMLGPSVNDGTPTIGELRPKGRGRPQRILLGNWPEDHVRQVIRAVVFRDGTIPQYHQNMMASGSPGPNNSQNPHHMVPSTTAAAATSKLTHGNNVINNNNNNSNGSQQNSHSSRSPSAVDPSLLGVDPLLSSGGVDGNASHQLSLAAQFKEFYQSHLKQFAAAAAASVATAAAATASGSSEAVRPQSDTENSELGGRHSRLDNRFEDAEDEEMNDFSTRLQHLRYSPGPHSSASNKGKRDLGESIFKLRERSLMRQQQQQQHQRQPFDEESNFDNDDDDSRSGLALNPEVILTEVSSASNMHRHQPSDLTWTPSVERSARPNSNDCTQKKALAVDHH